MSEPQVEKWRSAVEGGAVEDKAAEGSGDDVRPNVRPAALRVSNAVSCEKVEGSRIL